MSNEDPSRKRSLPEPIAHAMTVHDFIMFSDKTEYISMVRVELNAMKATAEADKDTKEVTRCKDALILLDFIEACVQNRHTVEGVEEVKQKFLQEVGATRDAISKNAVVSGMGGTL